MPEHATWFAFLPGYEALRAFVAGRMGDSTWIGHSPIDIQHVLGMLFVALVLVGIALVVRAKVRDAPRAIVPDAQLTLRTFVEVFTEATLGLMTDVMGAKAARFFLLLVGTCAFFIFFSNSLGLIPGFSPPTSNLNTTLACALVIFVSTHAFGVKEHGIGYFKHFLGPIVKWYALPLMVVMLAVETISHFARPMSLSIRLMANMTADHAVVGVFFALVPVLVPLPVMVLGALVCVVQTLVFCLLSTVYISMAVAHEGH